MSFVTRLVERLKELDQDRESGAAMVEFVIVFPVQLVLTLLIMQFALLMHAHVVVAQSAFMGARAAAVSDGMVPSGSAPQAAAERIAARTCVVLTSSDGAPNGMTTSPGGLPGNFTWSGGKDLSGVRQEQAYGHLNVQLAHSADLVQCFVEFDYVLIIPVANNILSRQTFQGFPFFNAGARNVSSTQRGLPCFRVRRVGYCPTPWLNSGLVGNAELTVGESGNLPAGSG